MIFDLPVWIRIAVAAGVLISSIILVSKLSAWLFRQESEEDKAWIEAYFARRWGKFRLAYQWLRHDGDEFVFKATGNSALPIYALVLEGYTNKEIARSADIPESAVEAVIWLWENTPPTLVLTTRIRPAIL